MKSKERISYLLQQYIKGEATEVEELELVEGLNCEEDKEAWEEELQQIAQAHPEDPFYNKKSWKFRFNRILRAARFRDASKKKWNNTRLIRRSALFTFPRVAAAVIIMVVGSIVWLRYNSSRGYPTTIANLPDAIKNDIPPGASKAILTLSDGSVIKLDSTLGESRIDQGGCDIKIDKGKLVYHKEHQKQITTLYNTIHTPPGGQYELTLSDGTKVWLNASSSLRYPVAFTEKDRAVTLTGEAYFEVVHDESHPFKVNFFGNEVQDLGTRFNIMAYPDEPSYKTTLLEGSVRVTKGSEVSLLSPGEQAVTKVKGGLKVIQDVNTSEAVSWKVGLFEFSDDDVASIMRAVSRWYDVKIAYPHGIPNGHITGKIPRNTNLSNVLRMMRLSGITCKLEGREVIVSSE